MFDTRQDRADLHVAEDVEPAPGLEGVVVPTATVERPPPSGRSPVWRVAVLIGALAFLVRVWAPGPTTQTVDEFAWTRRSEAFRIALMDGDLGRASTSAVSGPLATQPGVTTMWAGSTGYAIVAAAEQVGLLDRQEGRTTSDQARILRASRAVVGLWCAAALALLVVVATRLVGRRAALIAGVLLAAEPFLAGHSNVLHTDALVTMFGALAVVALAALGSPAEGLGEDAGTMDRAGAPPDRKLLVLAGVAAGVAGLTKLNALPLVLGGAAVVLLFRTDWRAGWRVAIPRVLRVGLTFVGVGVALFFVAWPALWVDFWSEMQRLPKSLEQLSNHHVTFFRYERTLDPGPLFYVYALAHRLSPWLFAGSLVSGVAIVAHLLLPRRRDRSGWPARSVLAVLLLAPAPYALLITYTGQKYDRYALPVVPYLALATGVVVAVAAQRWTARFGGRLLPPVAALGTVVVLTATLSVQPYAISYANPLVGGQERARKNILLGWGEGIEALGAVIHEREAHRCADVSIWAPPMFAELVAMPCGRVQVGLEVEEYDYVVVYISNVQRSDYMAVLGPARVEGELIEEVRIGGLTYAELWQVKR
jgi:hypothetical protein